MHTFFLVMSRANSKALVITASTFLALATSTSIAQNCTPLLTEDFGSYAVGSWPAPWARDGNATDGARNGVVADPTNSSNKVLKMYGRVAECWGALAYAPCPFPSEFVVHARVYNGGEVISGCHPSRGILVLRRGTYWGNPATFLFDFRGNGSLLGGDETTSLMTYQTGRWYDITVRYKRVGSTRQLHYWVDGVDRGGINQMIPDLNTELSFDHLDPACDEGTAYFDDLRVEAIQPADFNHDLQVDFFDYLDFVAAFAGNATSADVNLDGYIDFFDYLDFVQAFSAGC